MNNLETPYDEDTEFIECTVCEKSIRGDSLYRIHLTTPGHIKKEDALIAAGHFVRNYPVPVFQDIVQYLDYMKLDEPIIGLNYLEEVPNMDPQTGPKYTCKLCRQTAHLTEMVYHVIGRKHRQNYVEAKRPDLVTWDKQNIINQAGKIIRARAEMIERQDGRGSPMLMEKRGMVGKINNLRVPQKQEQYSDRNIPPSFTKFNNNIQNPTSYIPPLRNFDQLRYSLTEKQTPSYLPEEPHVSRDQQVRGGGDALSFDHMEVTQSRIKYKESHRQSQDYVNPDYDKKYGKEPQRRAVIEAGGVSCSNSWGEMTLTLAQHEECFPEQAPAYRRPYPEPGPAQYPSSQHLYQESDNPRQSLERECGRLDGLKRAATLVSSEPESKRTNLLSPMESDASSDRFFHIRDYGHKVRGPLREEVVRPNGEGSSNSQRQLEVTRPVSDIPEPFRRFLEGASSGEGVSKGRRKSRFSDATAEEIKRAKETFSDKFDPLNSKVHNYPRPVNEVLSPKSHGIQHPDIYSGSHGPHHSESYQRGVSESEDVFDILKSVEIENAEEAGYLKNKLCDLLKEFKAKKSEKAVQNSQSRPVVNKDYNNMGPASDLSVRQQYEMTPREDLDLRQPKGPCFQENQRKRPWMPEEHIPNKQLQEFHRPGYDKNRQPKMNRSRFNETFGRSNMSPPSTCPDEPLRFPQRFQESMHSFERRPREAFLDSHVSSFSFHMEQRSRWDRDPGYCKRLDKITATLLELVSRK